MIPRFGHAIVSFDPDHEEVGKFNIILPGKGRKPKTAFVHIHNYSQRFGEDLTGRRVVCDRWAARPFTIIYEDGKEYTFYAISQWAILGVFEDIADAHS